MEATNLQDPKQEDKIYIQSRVMMEKYLASPDKAKREKAMSLLCLYLTSQEDSKEEGLLKIWKGLFYCLWNAENAMAQADLIDRMSNLLERLDVEFSLLFFKVFLTALRREWDSSDKECVHQLLRHFIFHMFAVLQKSDWDAEVVGKFMDALAEGALLAQDGVVAHDVTIGIVGVFLHELKHYLPVQAGVFEALLEPFWMTLAKGGEKMVAENISEKIFLLLFDHGCRFLASKQGDHKAEEEVACFGTAALSLSFSIKSKSTALLPCASELNSVQLKLIQEKFTGLESLLVQSHLSLCNSIGKNCTGKIDQTESQSNGDVLNSLPDSGGSCTISPLQFLVTRTFGRRSKRNQKLAFSPHTVDSVYLMENVSSQAIPGNPLEDFPDTQRGTMKDKMSSLSKNQELKEGRTFEEVNSLDKNMDVACAPQQNNDNGEIIDIDGSPPQQEAAISEEEDTNGIMAAKEDGISIEDPVISNLTMRFESIADQSPCLQGYSSPEVFTPLAPSPINTGGRKRKSWRCSPMDALDESPTSTKENNLVPQDPCQAHDVASIDNISAKKAKKVHFSLQHNIVWKPSTPLPPHSLRVPPSATPRGSALKKGVPPGPIADLSEAPSVSPKKKKKATPRKAPSAHSRSPKSLKNSAKVIKPVKRGRLSPR